MKPLPLSIEAINAVLPQTQCGQCGYAGCQPYAEAIRQGAPIHLCPPGGLTGLQQLAALTDTPLTYELQQALTQAPAPVVARIREADCIGCTKCIQACPVDAIIGAAKQLHVVLTDDCTGCELCISPCPVDCIELMPVERLQYQKSRAQAHYQAKLARGAFKRAETVSALPPTVSSNDKKRFIADAVARAKAKKLAQTL